MLAFINPGHKVGIDPGACHPYGTTEAETVLEIGIQRQCTAFFCRSLLQYRRAFSPIAGHKHDNACKIQTNTKKPTKHRKPP